MPVLIYFNQSAHCCSGVLLLDFEENYTFLTEEFHGQNKTEYINFEYLNIS